MDDNNNIKKAPNVPPFLRYCSAIIPTAFDDSLSYYEALCALYKFLQDQVVTAINNNATVTEEYIQMTKDMKSYMDNYFDNLDVQEEINKKLDVMVEDGTMDQIINHNIFDELSAEVENKVDKDQPQYEGLNYERFGRIVDETFALTSGANGYFGMQGGIALEDGTYVFCTNHRSDMDTYADDLNKVRKIDLTTGAILTEKTISLGHANGIAYDSVENKYYVTPAHSNVSAIGFANKVFVLDSNLNYVQAFDTVANYDSISVDENGDVYGAITYKPSGITVQKLDKSDFSVLETISLSMPVADTIGTGQDICVKNGYIYFLQFNPNAVFVFDLEGNNISNYSINDNEFYALGELENISVLNDGTIIIGSSKQPTGNLYSFENIIKLNPVKSVAIDQSKRLYELYNQPFNPVAMYVDPDSTAFAPDGSEEKPFKCIDEITTLKIKNYVNIHLTNNKTYYVNRINAFDGAFYYSTGVTLNTGASATDLKIRNSNIYFNYTAELPAITVQYGSNVYIYHSNLNDSGAGFLIDVNEGGTVNVESITFTPRSDLTDYLFKNEHGIFNWSRGNVMPTTSGYGTLTKWFDGRINFLTPFTFFSGTLDKANTITINNGNLNPFKQFDIRLNDLMEVVIPARNQEFQNLVGNLSASGTGNNAIKNVTLKFTNGVLSVSKAIQMNIASSDGTVTMNTNPTVEIKNIYAI